MALERIWRLENSQDRAISTVLLPFSWIYALGWKIYLALYASGFKKRKRFDIPILCVGNLEVGGTGKTPVVIEIARLLSAAGKRVAIGASGYGSHGSAAARLAPAGCLDATQFGDEPALIRHQLPDVALIIGRRRVLAAQIAAENGFDALIMDDGFQHLPLHRDVDLLIFDADAGNKRCLPAGPMREPVSGASRATGFVGRGSFEIRREFLSLRNIKTGATETVEFLKGLRCSAVCGLGSPKQFFDTLTSLGAKLEQCIELPDHDALTLSLQQDIIWIVTEKDAVKLQNRADIPAETYALKMEIRFEKEEEFLAWLNQKLFR